MRVRSFQLSDHRSVEALLEQVLCDECLEETREALMRQLSWDSDLVLVAEHDETVIGVLIGTVEGHEGYIYRIEVHPDYRRQGVGNALIQAVNVRFRQRNIRQVLAAVDKHHPDFASFYQSVGLPSVDLAERARPLAILAG
jgi:ribosomal protein S18 acetylase RimI-like enzyme